MNFIQEILLLKVSVGNQMWTLRNMFNCAELVDVEVKKRVLIASKLIQQNYDIFLHHEEKLWNQIAQGFILNEVIYKKIMKCTTNILLPRAIL